MQQLAGTTNYAEKQKEEILEFDEIANLMSNVVDTINKGDKEEPSINSKPVLIKTEFLSKETDSITVKAVGTDEDNELLTYTLYVQEEGGEWQKGQELKETSVGEGTQLTASNLKNYTYYNWRVDVTDNIAGTVNGSTQARVRTYCPSRIANLYRWN